MKGASPEHRSNSRWAPRARRAYARRARSGALVDQAANISQKPVGRLKHEGVAPQGHDLAALEPRSLLRLQLLAVEQRAVGRPAVEDRDLARLELEEAVP